MNYSIELNVSCEKARLFGEQVLSDDVETVQRYIALSYYCLLFPFSISLTSFIIFLIIKFKHLRDTTFMLALQVVILNWVYMVMLTPGAVSSTVSGQWVLRKGMCKATGANQVFTFLLRNLLMFFFVLDRFCTVFIPFRYRRHRKKVVLTLWSIAVVLSAICVILPLIMNCHGFNRVLWLCLGVQISEYCPNSFFCNAYRIVLIATGEIAGSFIPLIMYILLFIKAKKIRNQIAPVENSQVDSEQRKRDRRANLTFFAMFLSLFGVSAPPLIAHIIIEVILPTLEVNSPEALILISFILQELHSLLPIVDSIVILRNPEMRKAIKMFKTD